MKIKKELFLLTGVLLLLASCNQNTSDTSKTTQDVTPPVISVGSYNEYHLNDEISIINGQAIDEVDGQCEVNYKVISPAGNIIDVSNGKFTASEIGEYTVIYSAKDKSENLATLNVKIKVNDTEKSSPIVTLTNISEKQYKVGESYDMPNVTITDEYTDISEYKIKVKNPDGGTYYLVNNSLVFDYVGTHVLTFEATNTYGKVGNASINVNVTDVKKLHVEGDALKYSSTKYSGRFGGLRGLEFINFKMYKDTNGVYFLFESDDKRVSRNERTEVFFDSEGTSTTIDKFTSRKLFVNLDGSINTLKPNGRDWVAFESGELAYSARPTSKVKLNEGTTLDNKNTNDNGYSMELFVPYSFIGVEKDDIFYISFGCVRDGDTGWDGWNDLGVYPDVNIPARYVEVSEEGLKNTTRLFQNHEHVNGVGNNDVYDGYGSTTTNVGGLRQKEKCNVKIGRDDDGYYFFLDVPDDYFVNQSDRVEVYLHIGKTNSKKEDKKTFIFYAYPTGNFEVMHGSYSQITPLEELSPEYTAFLHQGSTLNKNDDRDVGWQGEIFVPYSFFEHYSTTSEVNRDTRVSMTFGMWRTDVSYNSCDDWGEDLHKDWDGWNAVNYPTGFCDPQIPSSYAILMPDGGILGPGEVTDVIHPSTDPNTNGVLDEAYWNDSKTAVLNIDPTEELDGVTTKIYHDTNGLRVAFIGDVKKLTNKDIIMFYINTYDQSYTIGSEYLEDFYDVRGKYPNTGDYSFQIKLDGSIIVLNGKYKDYSQRITDLTDLQVAINIDTENIGYIVEMLIPYSFISDDNHVTTADDIMGFSVRLAGENSRGSVVWNNLYVGGVYCDSESPASYARIDKNGKIYAALDNSGDYRVDGILDEDIYKTNKAEVEIGDSKIDIYKSEKGIHAVYYFGENTDEIRFILSTFDHKLGSPYVYDYQIITGKNGNLEFSWGNSYEFYETWIYIPYSSPRFVVSEINGQKVGELFISYDYLSRYNTTGNYEEIGYKQITSSDTLRFEIDNNNSEIHSIKYNGTTVNGLCGENPDTYLVLNLKEEN